MPINYDDYAEGEWVVPPVAGKHVGIKILNGKPTPMISDEMRVKLQESASKMLAAAAKAIDEGYEEPSALAGRPIDPFPNRDLGTKPLGSIGPVIDDYFEEGDGERQNLLEVIADLANRNGIIGLDDDERLDEIARLTEQYRTLADDTEDDDD